MMAALLKLVAEIIVELRRLQAAPNRLIDKNDPFPLPRMIPVGNGGTMIISRKIDQNIAAVARRLMDGDASLKTKYTGAEWASEVRSAFGPPLAVIDLDANEHESAKPVLDSVRAAVGRHVAGILPREHAVGCTLFGNKDVASFSVGPVRFEPRHSWLERQVEGGAISAVTARRVERAWQGHKLAKRKPSVGSMNEDDILGTVGECPYVCSVTTTGLAAEAGREKSLVAARCALAAIALLWQTPSKALNGLNLLYDHSPHRRKILTFVPGGIMLAGSSLSHMPYAGSFGPGEWEKLLAANTDHFAVSGEILAFLLSPAGNVKRPRLMNALAQSLLWFHEGCRQTASMLAVVSFAASMDALASGGKSRGIRRVMNARLGIGDDVPIRPDGPTLRQAVDQIYSDARSRTIHGTNDQLGHDWSGTSGLAEQFARLCLRSCIDWAAANPSTDDPSRMQT